MVGKWHIKGYNEGEEILAWSPPLVSEGPPKPGSKWVGFGRITGGGLTFSLMTLSIAVAGRRGSATFGIAVK
jgi:hypothetical protein